MVSGIFWRRILLVVLAGGLVHLGSGSVRTAENEGAPALN